MIGAATFGREPPSDKILGSEEAPALGRILGKLLGSGEEASALWRLLGEFLGAEKGELVRTKEEKAAA